MIQSPKTTSRRQHQRTKKAAIALLFIALFVVAPIVVDAQDVNLTETGAAAGFGTASLPQIVANVIRIFLGLLGVIALIIVLYGGFIWMTSAGNPEKVTKAKQILTNGIIGLILIASAFAITQFLITKLGAATGTFIGTGAGSGLGADFASFKGNTGLGKVIASHYPERNEQGVSRTAKIIVTFKAPIKLSSLITDANGDGQLGTPVEQPDKTFKYDTINQKAFELFVTPAVDAPKQLITDINVQTTSDANDKDNYKKTFIFDPVPVLGSSTTTVKYTVRLTSGLLFDTGASAFASINEPDYAWEFETSTNEDTTPPQVASVVPFPESAVARNVLVQVNFTEPVDPLSASGIVASNNLKSFSNVTVSGATSQVIAGTVKISNQYKTVEFVSDVQCGTNACGASVFCLPPTELMTVTAKAADMQQGNEPLGLFHADGYFGYHGVVDMSGNSLDGGGVLGAEKNGKADGPPSDNYLYRFTTTGEVKITPPKITAVSPAIGATAADIKDPAAPVTIAFDTLMSPSGYADVTLSAQPDKAGVGFWTANNNAPADSPDHSELLLKHSPYATNSVYAPNIPSTVTDIYQNCFFPSAGLSCGGTPPSGKNTCCGGVWSESCLLPSAP